MMSKKLENKMDMRTLSVAQLVRGKYQPRRHFDETALQELAQSIRSNGLLQPILVRPLAQEGQFEIIAGERRWRAAQLAELCDVPCLVKHLTDDQAAEATAIENVIREDLNPIEEARAYQRLIDDFHYIHEEIALAIGKSRTKITNALRLLKLSTAVKEFLMNRKLSEGHGKILGGLSPSDQLMLAKKTIARGWSVRKLEREVKKLGTEKISTALGRDPNLKYLEQSLSEHLGCPVAIDYEEMRGQLKCDFKNLDILEGILQKMGCVKEKV
jgi:ParB family chromosome partitioning protein